MPITEPPEPAALLAYSLPMPRSMSRAAERLARRRLRREVLAGLAEAPALAAGVPFTLLLTEGQRSGPAWSGPGSAAGRRRPGA